MFFSDDTKRSIAKFFIDVNDLFSGKIKFDDNIPGFDDTSIDKNQRIKYLFS